MTKKSLRMSDGNHTNLKGCSPYLAGISNPQGAGAMGPTLKSGRKRQGSMCHWKDFGYLYSPVSKSSSPAFQLRYCIHPVL